MSKVGRNSRCPCGSGRKYKHCCLPTAETPAASAAFAGPPSVAKVAPRTPGHVPSVVAQGYRHRAIWKTIYRRPAGETFHEFLANLVDWTLGQTWWKHQQALPLADRHAVRTWQAALAETTRRPPTHSSRTEHGEQFATIPSGPAYALIALGYDLYCLAGCDRLPDFIVDRLRRNKDFQSARYEVAVAAMMTRADFDVRFLDDVEHEQSHCEFVATCRRTGERFGVEAKSRVRSGVLHQRGEFEYDGDVRGLVSLLRKASGQGVEGLPLVIFIDVNMPPMPTVQPNRKPWADDLSAAVDELERKRDAAMAPDPYALICATNIGFHFDTTTGVVAPTEFGFISARRPAIPLQDPRLPRRVMDAVTAYGRIPSEV